MRPKLLVCAGNTVGRHDEAPVPQAPFWWNQVLPSRPAINVGPWPAQQSACLPQRPAAKQMALGLWSDLASLRFARGEVRRRNALVAGVNLGLPRPFFP